MISAKCLTFRIKTQPHCSNTALIEKWSREKRTPQHGWIKLSSSQSISDGGSLIYFICASQLSCSRLLCWFAFNMKKKKIKHLSQSRTAIHFVNLKRDTSWKLVHNTPKKCFVLVLPGILQWKRREKWFFFYLVRCLYSLSWWECQVEIRRESQSQFLSCGARIETGSSLVSSAAARSSPRDLQPTTALSLLYRRTIPPGWGRAGRSGGMGVVRRVGGSRSPICKRNREENTHGHPGEQEECRNTAYVQCRNSRTELRKDQRDFLGKVCPACCCLGRNSSLPAVGVTGQ